MRCPSGGDDECATHPLHGDVVDLGLKCMSGVADCKDEKGLGAYGMEDPTTETGTGTGTGTEIDTETEGEGGVRMRPLRRRRTRRRRTRPSFP